jgi:DUF917 family protein
MWQLDEEKLEDITVGSTILGAGGGGNPYVGRLVAREVIRKHGPVDVVDLEEIPDDAFVITSAWMGAPTVFVEKLPRAEEMVWAFEGLQEYLGKKATHALSVEAGGLNALAPVSVAATLGIPLVDGDGMGRAFPHLHLTTQYVLGSQVTPMCIVDERGNRAFIESVDGEWSEKMARPLAVAFGTASSVACYPMTGLEVKERVVGRTLTLAADLGRLLREARAGQGDGVAALLSAHGGRLLGEGKITELRRHTERGWVFGECGIEGTGEDKGSTFTVHFQNEHLVAKRDGEFVASVPDLIMLLVAETGEPVPVEDLRYGFRVALVALPCDPMWRTEAALEVAGPRRFGYDLDYVPVEQVIET